ncbi:MAG: hypothetical protein IJ019_01290 [Alphaproteobacteria bacterium]|nr:hypothetical protein [Alphaproteobacteria bacterium]
MGIWDKAEEISYALQTVEDPYREFRRYIDMFESKYPKTKLSINEKSTEEIEKLAEIINKLYNGSCYDLTDEDKSFMTRFGVSDSLVKEDITYDDIKDFPEFSGLKELYNRSSDWNKKNVASWFSAHKCIIHHFLEQMRDISVQDNNESLYLRLVLMSKYRINYGDPYKKHYNDPQRRIYFIKTYLATYPSKTIGSFIYNPDLQIYGIEKGEYYRTMVDLFDGIHPKAAVDLFINTCSSIDVDKSSSSFCTHPLFRLGDIQKAIPYIMEAINDNRIDLLHKENYIKFLDRQIQYHHCDAYGIKDETLKNAIVSWSFSRKYYWNDTPYTDIEMQFYDYIDQKLSERSKAAYELGDVDLLNQMAFMIKGSRNPNNPKTTELTQNQIKFYDEYLPLLNVNVFPLEYIKNLSDEKFILWMNNVVNKHKGKLSEYYSKEDCIINKMLNAPETVQQLWIYKLRMATQGNGKLDDFAKCFFVAKGLSEYNALSAFDLINKPDKLSKAINEGFWIYSTNDKLRTYDSICEKIYKSNLLDRYYDPIHKRLRTVGLEVLEKLNKKYPLKDDEISQLSPDTLKVLICTDYIDLKDKKMKMGCRDDGRIDNKIDEMLLRSGKYLISAETQVRKCSISEYCDINEIWNETYHDNMERKTNLLDHNLQSDNIRNVIELINRGVDVSIQVERINKQGRKFPISPFERYISFILYRNKDKELKSLESKMKQIAEEINSDKFPVINKIFNSLSPKTRNDSRIKDIEKIINQIVNRRSPNILGIINKDNNVNT